MFSIVFDGSTEFGDLELIVTVFGGGFVEGLSHAFDLVREYFDLSL